MLKKRFVFKTIASMMCSLITISAFKFADVGALDDISLQSPVSSLEIIVPYIPQQHEAPVSSPAPDSLRVDRKDAIIIEENTYLVSSDDFDSEEELLDESAFTYDGSEVWVNVNLVNVRQEPSVDSEVLDQLEYGSSVVRISYGSLWSKIRLEDGTEGFVMTSLITDEEVVIEEEPEQEEPVPTPTPAPTAAPTPTPVPVPAQTPAAPAETTVPETTAAPAETAPVYTESEYNATVYASCDINVRTGPGTSYPFVMLISRGDSISVVALTSNGWYKLSSGNYIKADLTQNEPLPEPTPVPAPDPAAPSVSAGDGSGFADYCGQFQGVPYVYGGASPSGFDCSGYVSYVYANYYGISLPHDAAGIAQCGTAVSMDSLQCGDVICHDYNNDGYIEHVSIYIGNGTYIHASDSRRGVVVTTYCGGVATVRRFV